MDRCTVYGFGKGGRTRCEVQYEKKKSGEGVYAWQGEGVELGYGGQETMLAVVVATERAKLLSRSEKGFTSSVGQTASIFTPPGVCTIGRESRKPQGNRRRVRDVDSWCKCE